MVHLNEPDGLREKQLQVLTDCDLLTLDDDLELDAVTRLAAAVTGYQVATVNVLLPDVACSLSDSVRGSGDRADPPMVREDSFCHRATLVGGPVNSGDCTTDPMFLDLPWVDGRIASFRRYAMAPLEVDGLTVGTLCVIDTRAGDALAPERLQHLVDLAAVASALLQRRRSGRVAAAAHDELVRTRAFDRALLQSLPVGVAAAGADRRLTHFNDTLLGWYGRADADDLDLVPQDWSRTFAMYEVDGTTPMPLERVPLMRVFEEGVVTGAEFVVRPADRAPRTVSASGAQVRDDSGRLLGAVVALADITAQRALEAQLREAATHDVLTGLPNRAMLVQELERALDGHQTAAATRGGLDGGCEGDGVAVLYCDLDGFKAVNDRYGHATGDAVLVAVARRLTAALRQHDVVARLGGDEFVVVCPYVPGAFVAEAISRRITDCLLEPVVVDGVAHPVGISVGAVLSRSGEGSASAERLLSAADALMYERKRLRREERERAAARSAPAVAPAELGR